MFEKKELNLGEQFVFALVTELDSGALDKYVYKERVFIFEGTALHTYRFENPYHVAGGLICKYVARTVCGDDYIVSHLLLDDFRIRHDVAKELFWSMKRVGDRREEKIQKGKNDALKLYINSINRKDEK